MARSSETHIIRVKESAKSDCRFGILVKNYTRFQKMASRVQSAMRALRLAGVGPKTGLRAPGLGRTLPAQAATQREHASVVPRCRHRAAGPLPCSPVEEGVEVASQRTVGVAAQKLPCSSRTHPGVLASSPAQQPHPVSRKVLRCCWLRLRARRAPRHEEPATTLLVRRS